MKKISSLFVGFLLLFILSVNIIRAQTFDFNKAYQDYQFSLDVYNQSNSLFTQARDAYLKNRTLTLKEEARKKLLTMLRDRDELVIVYLTALRMKLLESEGLSGDEKNTIFGKIDSEVSWYKEHKSNLKDSDTAEDLFNKSSEGESRNKTITQPIIYYSLFYISLSEEIDIRKDHETIYSFLKQVIDKGVTEGTLKADPFGRWFTDIDNVVNLLKQKETDGRTAIEKIYSGQFFSTTNTYEAAVDILESSVMNLRQLNNFVTELLVSIKNQGQ